MTVNKWNHFPNFQILIYFKLKSLFFLIRHVAYSFYQTRNKEYKNILQFQKLKKKSEPPQNWGGGGGVLHFWPFTTRDELQEKIFRLNYSSGQQMEENELVLVSYHGDVIPVEEDLVQFGYPSSLGGELTGTQRRSEVSWTNTAGRVEKSNEWTYNSVTSSSTMSAAQS